MTSKSKYSIRRALNADSPAIQDLVFPIMQEFGLDPDPAGADADLLEIQSAYDAHGGWLELVFDCDDLIATVGMLPVGQHSIELRKMYLRSDRRGSGLGKALLARCIRRAGANGYRKIVLETATVLETAIALYQKFGFVRDLEKYPGCGKRVCDQVWTLKLENYRPGQINLPDFEESR